MWNGRKKWRCRNALVCILLALIFLNGCSVPWGKEDGEEGLREEITALLPDGEAIDEIQIMEREKTRDAVRYQVYCRWNNSDGKAACERYYQVTCCRKNGRWVYDTRTGIRLLEERTLEAW